MAIAFFWVLFAVAVGVFASNRGRSGFGWFFLSLVISPLLGLLFCAVSKNLNAPIFATIPSERTHRKCPSCAELVLPEAIICKHCGRELSPDPMHQQREATKEKEAEAKGQTDLIMGIIFIAALFAIAGVLSKYIG